MWAPHGTRSLPTVRSIFLVCGRPGQKLPSSHALYADASVVRLGSTAGIASAAAEGPLPDATGRAGRVDGVPDGGAATGAEGMPWGIAAVAPPAMAPPMRASEVTAMAMRCSRGFSLSRFRPGAVQGTDDQVHTDPM